MPAFGLSAVPAPTKNRMKSVIGLAPTADATGETALAAAPISVAPASSGSPRLVAAAGAAVRCLPRNSRRLAAAAAHANGAIAGSPPSPSLSSHDVSPASRSLIPSAAAAARGADTMTGTVTSRTSAVRAEAAAGDGAVIAGSEAAGVSPCVSDERQESVIPIAAVCGSPGATESPAWTPPLTDGRVPCSFCSRISAPITETARESAPLAEPRSSKPIIASPEAPAAGATDPPRAAREPRRGPDTVAVFPAEDSTPDPADPDDPDLSAAAIGAQPTADPTPKATAKAPTRPTYRT